MDEHVTSNSPIQRTAPVTVSFQSENELAAKGVALVNVSHLSEAELVAKGVAIVTISSEYISLASALSEAVPPIAPAVQEVIAPIVGHRDLSTRFILKADNAEPSPEAIDIVRQGNEQVITGLQVIANDYRDMLMKHLAEPLRQAQMSFNIARWFVPGLLTLGTAIIVIGVIVAFMAHNFLIGGSIGLVGGIVDATAIIRSFNKEANEPLDPNTKYLVALTQFTSAGEYISKIENVELRNQSYAELAKEITDLNKRIL